MRLNMDCVRDILLCVEENTGLRKSCLFVDISPFANDVRRALGDNPMDTEVQAVLAKAGVFGLDVMFGVANDLAIQSAKSMIGL